MTYLHLLAGDNLKVPSPARLAHTLPANATQPMEQESCAGSSHSKSTGWEGSNPPFGEQGGGKANLRLTGLHIGVRGAFPSPKCLNLGGKSKEKLTMSFSACKKEIMMSQQDLEAPAGGRERTEEMSKKSLTSLFLIYQRSKTGALSTAGHALLDGFPPQPGVLPAARAAGRQSAPRGGAGLPPCAQGHLVDFVGNGVVIHRVGVAAQGLGVGGRGAAAHLGSVAQAGAEGRHRGRRRG